MPQPVLGLVATALVIAVSLGYLTLFEFGTFVGWVAFVMLCLIPPQVVTVVLAPNPLFGRGRPQPARGAALLLPTLAAGLLLAGVVLGVAGEGVTPPGPIPSHFAVIVVPTTFFLAIMFGGWPFTRLSRKGSVVAVSVVVAAYVITYVLFRTFFDYGFLQGTPAALESAPEGVFAAPTALVFWVTVLAAMFLPLHFDLWPLGRVPALTAQPLLGVVWFVVALIGGALVMQATGSRDKDPMWVLTRITAPFIFGTIVVLNMLQNSLFAWLRQPLKGIANTLAAAAIGAALGQVYGYFSDWWFSELPMGQPGYEYELWLVNALLSVTFPFLIFYAAYFDFWPIAGAKAGAAEAAKT